MAIFPFKKEEKDEDEEKGFLRAIKETEKVEGKPGEIAPEALPSEIKKEEKKKRETERRPEEKGEQPVAAPAQLSPTPTAAEVIAPPKITKSPVLMEIEQILSENLDELYASLSAEQKLAFKRKGEETASRIELLIKEVKINVKKILLLIKEWLLMLVQMIPGVNKIFLVQEAKIKADKILFLAERKKNAKIVKN